MPFPFVVKKYHLHHLFQPKKKREKRKLTKSRFSKDKHLFSKLGAFSYALSPLSRTSKIHSSLSKEKKKKKPFSKIKGHHAQVFRLGTFDYASFR